MFLISNKLEELEFKLEKKILGFRNMQEKLEKGFSSVCISHVNSYRYSLDKGKVARVSNVREMDNFTAFSLSIVFSG